MQVENTINSSTNSKPPKVSVCVVTYNQEKYIGQCLQSLVDQKTDFDFEVIVGDDCSTDNTKLIIQQFARKYPNKVRAIYHPSNIGAVANYLAVQKAVRGEYIAHVDGDDYALPNKLQTQAEYLDKHPKCAVVWHRMKILDEKSGKIHNDLINSPLLLRKRYKQEDLLAIGSVSCHSSKFFRRSSIPNKYPDGDFLDFLVNVENLSKGYGAYIDSFLGVYRSGVGSMQNPRIKNLFIENLIYLSSKYPDKRGYASALFLKMLIIDFKKDRKNIKILTKNFISNFQYITPFCFLKNIRHIKYFRSPI